MDLYNREDLKEFLVSIYGNQANDWDMNERVFNLAHELVRETGRCSSAIDLVPRPMGPGQTAYSYLSSLARGAFLRYIKQNKEQYKICTSTVALKKLRSFQLASMGL
jgi:hypothetical protein